MTFKTQAGEDIHTMPNDGTHECSKDCWCEPELIGDYTSEGGKKHWLHKEIQ